MCADATVAPEEELTSTVHLRTRLEAVSRFPALPLDLPAFFDP